MVEKGAVEILSGGSRNLRSGILAGCPRDDRRACEDDIKPEGAQHAAPLLVTLGLGFVLVEPAGYVQHFGDVVAGAPADAVRLFRNADEDGVDIQQL